MPKVLAPDDLTPGQMLTVLRGRQHTCPCGCGGTGPDSYRQLKGVPLVVLSVNLPYLIGGMVHGQVNVVIDVRECELCAVSDGYVEAFRNGQS